MFLTLIEWWIYILHHSRCIMYRYWRNCCRVLHCTGVHIRYWSYFTDYVQFNGFYLENNPCLVCNHVESPFSTIKLSSVRSDTRYTTTQQITKLTGSYAIQKAVIKVNDVKKTKMVSVINLVNRRITLENYFTLSSNKVFCKTKFALSDGIYWSVILKINICDCVCGRGKFI